MSNEGDGSLAKARNQYHRRVIGLIRRLGDVSSQTEALILEVRTTRLSYCALIDQNISMTMPEWQQNSRHSFSLASLASISASALVVRCIMHAMVYEIDVGVLAYHEISDRGSVQSYQQLNTPLAIAGTSAGCLESPEEAEGHS